MRGAILQMELHATRRFRLHHCGHVHGQRLAQRALQRLRRQTNAAAAVAVEPDQAHRDAQRNRKISLAKGNSSSSRSRSSQTTVVQSPM